MRAGLMEKCGEIRTKRHHDAMESMRLVGISGWGIESYRWVSERWCEMEIATIHNMGEIRLFFFDYVNMCRDVMSHIWGNIFS